MRNPDQPRIDANEHKRKHWNLCNQIVGVFYSVYNELGYGFLEAVYEEALYIGLTEAGLSVARQIAAPIWFHSRVIGEYKADLIVNNAVLLELKAARVLDLTHVVQIMNYLRVTNI